MTDEVSLSGWLVFGEDAVPFEHARIAIVLEDVTYADVPAVPLARTVLSDASSDGRPGGRLPFSFTGVRLGLGRRHSLRVLIDLDGDGKPGPGDYRNAESVAVDARSTTDQVVRLRRVQEHIQVRDAG